MLDCIVKVTEAVACLLHAYIDLLAVVLEGLHFGVQGTGVCLEGIAFYEDFVQFIVLLLAA